MFTHYHFHFHFIFIFIFIFNFDFHFHFHFHFQFHFHFFRTRYRDHLSLRNSLYALWNCGGGTEGTQIILEGLGWHMSRPTSAAIARHAMALFLNAAETSRSASSRSEASDLLLSIGRQIKAVGVRLRGFHLDIALNDSVCVREWLAGIAFGGRGIRSRNGEAQDHRHCRRAPRRRRVDAGVGGMGPKSKVGVRRDCRRERNPCVVEEG